MTNCKYITKNGRCGLKGSYAYRHGCYGEDMCKCREPMINADRFRAMSDEEQQNCVRKFWEIEDFADWLQQPAKGE